MKFLIDECLHDTLPQRCWDAGYEAHHVNHLRLNGTKDPALMPVVIERSFTFITNNARDFRRLFLLQEIHAGLIILLPNVPPPEQGELLDAVLADLAADEDIVNKAIEADFDGDTVRIRRFDLALPT